jgi:uncharacterized protein (TIGR00255 family)
MTGFGRAKNNINQREYNVEIKSVNHKYCDINVKVPRNLNYLEEKIKKQLSNKVSRGKFDVFIGFYDYGCEKRNLSLNKELAKLYIEELKSLASETNVDSEIKITDICKIPEIMQLQMSSEGEEEIESELLTCVDEAIISLDNMKNAEGNKIKEDLSSRIDKIESMILQICEYSTGLIDEYIVKLKERINKLNMSEIIDETRIAQEIVIYSDKCSIEEELTRLKSHVEQFRELLERDLPVGKKLDFIIQEMNRETNTSGSKSVKLEITNLVIEIKTELENIREQIQNIE